MSKIRDTLALVKSGARTNKYRVLFPLFGQEIDILCHASSNPGREIGTVEVFLKGRKFQMAGDMSDEGSWTMTIYNTEDFLVRSFFLKVISGIQNFDTPITLDDGYSGAGQLFQGFSYSGSGSNLYDSTDSAVGAYNFLTSIGKGQMTDTMATVNSVYNELRHNWNMVDAAISNVRDIINDNSVVQADGPVRNNSPFSYTKYYQARPWYMSDIIIQQLDHDDNPVTNTRLLNGFITNVGGIDYTDETGEISTTELTFAFSGIEYGVDGVYITY